LDRAKQKYFDLIVLDLDPSAENGLSLYQELKSYPELAGLSTVILAPCQLLSRRMSGFGGGPVHFLAKDSEVEVRLLQLIELVHHLRYRYLDLLL
jgi:CheY-like chemotaxis protein